MQRRIERLVSGQAKKLASAAQPFSFFLHSSNKQLQVDSKYVDLQVGKQVWYNVPRRMRQELWLSVLHKHKGAGAIAARQFATFVKQSLPEDVDADIEKDVGRTFPDSARFASEGGKLSLQRVLRAYAVFDTEVGYCQGMNFLAGLLLTYMPNEACAFGGLVVLMQERQLRELYRTDLAQLQLYLWQFGSLLPAKLKQHLDEQGTLPVLYVSSWLLTCFGSEYPLFFSSRVLDVVLTGSYPHAMIKVALALLQHCEKQLLPMTDMEDIVHFLKAEVPCWSREVLQDILSDALSQPWTAEQEAVLGNDEGMESVVDAVGRVSSLPRSGSRTPTKPFSAAESPASTAAAAAQVLNTPQHSNSKAPINSTNTDSTSSPLGPSALPPKGPPSSNGPARGSSKPKGPALASSKSASWAARLHASPTTAVLPSARRHTTEEEGHGLQGSGPQGVVLSLPSSSSRRESEDGATSSLAVPIDAASIIQRGSLPGSAADTDSPIIDLLGLSTNEEQEEWGESVWPRQEAAGAAEQADHQQPGIGQASAYARAAQSGAGDLPYTSTSEQAAGELLDPSSSGQAAGDLSHPSTSRQAIEAIQGAAVQQYGTDEGDLHSWADDAQWQNVDEAPYDQMSHDDWHHLSTLSLDQRSIPSLQADPSMLSTASDVQQLDHWHCTGASVLPPSSNIQQLEDCWHEDEDFGGFESATASSHSPDSLPAVQVRSQSWCEQPHQTTPVSQGLHVDQAPEHPPAVAADLDQWGSYVLPDSVAAQGRTEELNFDVNESLRAANAYHRTQRISRSESDYPVSNDQSSSPAVSVLSIAQSVSSLSAEHITQKQQKQLELFTQSISDQSRASR